MLKFIRKGIILIIIVVIYMSASSCKLAQDCTNAHRECWHNLKEKVKGTSHKCYKF